jgi:prepilin-type N-terminal cleavage/methylation domain-containing protein
MNKNKGFTLIELLVVIAIIGIISSVVVVLLGSARNRGNDAVVKSNLHGALVQAEILYNTRTAKQNTYTSVCTNGTVDGAKGIGVMVLAAAKAVGLSSYGTGTTGTGVIATCNDSAGAYAAEVPLGGSTVASPKMWCIDSLGIEKQTTSTIGTKMVCGN